MAIAAWATLTAGSAGAAQAPSATTTTSAGTPITAPPTTRPPDPFSLGGAVPSNGDDDADVADNRADDDAPAGDRDQGFDQSPPSPGLFDIAGRISNAINKWFRNLVAGALEPVLDLVAQTVFSTPDVSAPGRARSLWLISMAMANTLLVLLVTVGGFILMGHETLQTNVSLKELLPRVVVAFVCANTSLYVAGLAIRVTNEVSLAFLSTAETPRATAMEGMKTMALEPLSQAGPLVIVLLLLVVVVLAVGLICVYVLRVATVVVLAAAGPLFLVGHVLPQTAGAARLWWRALLGCLAVQLGQAFLLAMALRVLFDADGQRALGIPGGSFMDVVIIGCLFWLMLRLPTYASRVIFSAQRTTVAMQAARYYVLGRGLGRTVPGTP